MLYISTLTTSFAKILRLRIPLAGWDSIYIGFICCRAFDRFCGEKNNTLFFHLREREGHLPDKLFFHFDYFMIDARHASGFTKLLARHDAQCIFRAYGIIRVPVSDAPLFPIISGAGQRAALCYAGPLPAISPSTVIISPAGRCWFRCICHERHSPIHLPALILPNSRRFLWAWLISSAHARDIRRRAWYLGALLLLICVIAGIHMTITAYNDDATSRQPIFHSHLLSGRDILSCAWSMVRLVMQLLYQILCSIAWLRPEFFFITFSRWWYLLRKAAAPHATKPIKAA